MNECTAVRHGTWAAAQKHGCSCPDAVEALRLYRKHHRLGVAQPRLVDVLGSTRRLQALMAIGHTQRAVAAELGWSRNIVGHIAVASHPTIQVAKAQALAVLYERLSAVPGPSDRVRLWAVRRGFPPPLAWDDIDDPGEVPMPPQDQGWPDMVAIERACRRGVGSVALTETELAEVKRRLLESVLPAHEVADLLKVNVRTIDRWRASTRPSEEAA